MTDKKEVWTLANNTMQAFTPFYQEKTYQVIEASGLPTAWFALNLARGCHPEPLTVERFLAMNPYTARQRAMAVLAELVERGFLEPAGEGAYRLSENGRQVVEAIFYAAHEGLADAEPLPADEMDQLNTLLSRIVTATLAAPQPADKWSLRYSRWTDPGENGSAAAKTDQYLTDLTRYRDDAHIAAWQPYGVSGAAWEALTYIWRGRAQNAAELAERLVNRGHTAAAYTSALQELLTRGWVEVEDGQYRLTAEGRQVREAAEETTDHHFFVGWSALDQAELAQLEELLQRVRQYLKQAGLTRLWGEALNVSLAIYTATRSLVEPVLGEAFNLPGSFAYVSLADSLAPAPVSRAHFQKQFPYNNPAQVADRLNSLTEAGLLTRQGDQHYTLSQGGKAALAHVKGIFYTGLSEMDVLPTADLEVIAELLNRLVQAALEASEPADKSLLINSYNGHGATVYGPLARIDQRLDDLRAFRDDAHLAAWQPYGVSGKTWETFTLIWHGQAENAADLAERLSPRGYGETDYAGALAELAERGWLQHTRTGFQLTDDGRRLREAAEMATNRYFFLPWTGLDETEQANLGYQLMRLKLGLQRKVS